MKIDRLIGILSILLQKDKVTAPYLAEKFEVSRRTINRDIEDLCKAGIPLVTTQGVNGGISIMEGYKIYVFCQVLFPEKSVGIPFFQQVIFPAFSGHYASLRMRACSIR